MIIIVDIETSGLDPVQNGLLSIGAVNYNDPTKQFYGECRLRDGATYLDNALNVNGFTHEEIFNKEKQTEVGLLKSFLNWWNSFFEPKIIAGQNVFFDMAFLKHGLLSAGLADPLGIRIIDQHSICFDSFLKNGFEIPKEDGQYKLNSDTIMKYVGIPAEPKPHNALNGAVWETEALGRLLEGKNILEQFSVYPIPEYIKKIM